VFIKLPPIREAALAPTGAEWPAAMLSGLSRLLRPFLFSEEKSKAERKHEFRVFQLM